MFIGETDFKAIQNSIPPLPSSSPYSPSSPSSIMIPRTDGRTGGETDSSFSREAYHIKYTIFNLQDY